MSRRLLFEFRYLFSRAPWDTNISPPELLTILERCPPGRAIDLGCGTGTNAITMAKRGWQVSGIDFSALAIQRARRNARAAGTQIDFHQGDVVELQDIQGLFDLGLDIGCYHSLSAQDRLRYARHLAQRITPGGTVLLYTFLEPENQHRRWPTKTTVRDCFGEAFEILAADHGADRHRSSAWFTMQRKA
ncbi:MAG: class I SAM-dependent methyltransferase [Anaerolineales bacterium]